MNLPTASAVTWSMTSGGEKPFRGQRVGAGIRSFATRQCAKCHEEYTPTSPRQQKCQACQNPKTVAERLKRKTRTLSTALDEAPDDAAEVPGWMRSGPWKTVESAWVALMVEQFATDDNRGAMALALSNIRDRYRSRSGTAAPQAVE